MKRKTLLVIMALIFAIFAFGQSQRTYFAGHFLGPEHLESDLRKDVRDDAAIDFSDSIRADLDMDGLNDLVTRRGGLTVAFQLADSSYRTVELSNEDGKIAVADVTGDGIPDILQNTGIGGLKIYVNTAMPAIVPQMIPIREDHAFYFNYPNYSDSLKIDYQATIDDKHVGITPDSKGLLITTAPDWNGSANLNIIYSLADYRDTVNIAVLILPVNDPPVIQAQPELIVLPEDGSVEIFADSLLSLASDPDSGDVLSIYPLGDRVELSRSDSLFTYRPAANWHGDDSLSFAVTDGELSDTLTLRLRVQSVNDVPQWTSLAAVEFPEDEFKQLPLSFFAEHASDVETPDSLLRFRVYSGRHVAISAEGGTITLMGDRNWFGTDSVMLTVSDRDLADTTYWTITVTSVNDAPELSALPDTLFMEDETIYINKKDLETFAYDVETDPSDLKWQVKRFGKIRAFYNGVQIKCSASPDWYGTDSLELTVSDGELSASRIWKVHVLPVNDAPVFTYNMYVPKTKIPPRIFLEDDTLTIPKAHLYKMVKDPETASKDLTWALLPSPKVNYDEDEKAYHVYAAPDWFGDTYVRVAVSDGEYSDTLRQNIRVLSVNDKPVMRDPAPRTWNEDDTLSVDFSYLETYASDIETKKKDLMWAFVDNDHIAIKYRKPGVTLIPDQDWYGNTSLGVIVFDGGLRDTGYMDITIKPVNDAPRWSAFPDTTIDEDGSMVLPLSLVRGLVHDPDISDKISIEYTAGKNFYVEEKTDTLVLWPLEDWYGNESLEFTATDGKKKVKATWTISVRSINDAPYFTMGLPDSISFRANGSDTLFFKDIVYDVDNDIKDLVWEVTPGRIVRSVIDESLGGIIFYTENYKSGDDAVNIRVTDGHDQIVYYMPILVREIDRFLMSNPEKLELLPNTPNPFTDYTDIRYSLPVPANVSIKIYNLLGKEIKDLARGHHDAQNYSVRWWGNTESNMPAPSGVYLCRMVAVIEGETAIMMQKMMLVR